MSYIEMLYTNFHCQAIVLFSILVYIHANFTSLPMKCLENVQKTWPRDGILRVQIAQNSTIRVTNGNTVYNDVEEGDILNDETPSEDMTLYENMSSNILNQSNLDLLYSIPEDKPAMNFKPMRETLPNSYDSAIDG